MSDDGVDNNKPSIRLQQIHHLKELVLNLEKVAISSENKDHVAGEILAQHKNISNYLDKMKQSSEARGREIGQDLLAYLTDPVEHEPSAIPPDIRGYWKCFHDKLKAIEGTGEDFRRHCLFHTQDGRTIMHMVCRKNPPVYVVKTLLEIIPYASETDAQQYNHLAIYKREDLYPLQQIIQHGGSLELVKLLVDADHKKESLSIVGGGDEPRSSVFHTLIAYREAYQRQPEVFSEILRYLCCVGIGTYRPGLLYQAECYNKMTPLLLFVQSLINKEGLNGQAIMRNSDYTFLLKATCYSHKSKNNKDYLVDLDMVRRDIEAIPLSEAFLVCTPCFNEKIVDKVLNELLSVNCQFLFEKDSYGQYPIHRMINDNLKWPSYFVNTIIRNHEDDSQLRRVILKIVLKHAPRSAQLRNNEGRLPLHIVSDAQGRRFTDDDRLDLVSVIWNAYSDAAEAIDGKTGLHSFALAVRGEDEDTIKETAKYNPELVRFEEMYRGFSDLLGMDLNHTTSLSSSFFLLRQQPDIISNYIVSGENAGSNQQPEAKRTKTNDG